MRRLQLALPLAGFICLLIPSPARAQYVDPETYKSPSGLYSLHVQPSSPRGLGPCQLSLSFQGRRLWSKTLPYTLYRVAVDNSGCLGSYGYEGDPYYSERATMHFTFLSREGQIVRDVSQKLKDAPMTDSPLVPWLQDFHVNTVSRRIIVQLHGFRNSNSQDDFTEWLVFDLPTGADVTGPDKQIEIAEEQRAYSKFQKKWDKAEEAKEADPYKFK